MSKPWVSLHMFLPTTSKQHKTKKAHKRSSESTEVVEPEMDPWHNQILEHQCPWLWNHLNTIGSGPQQLQQCVEHTKSSGPCCWLSPSWLVPIPLSASLGLDSIKNSQKENHGAVAPRQNILCSLFTWLGQLRMHHQRHPRWLFTKTLIAPMCCLSSVEWRANEIPINS